MTKSKVDLSKLKKWTDVKDSIQQFLNNLGSSGVLELQNWLNEYPIRNRRHRVAACAFPMRVAYVKDPEQYKLKCKEFASGLGCTFEFTEYSDYGDRFLTATLSVARDKDWCRLNGIQLPEREVPIDNIINHNPLLRLRIVDNVNKQIREIFPHASDDTIKKSKAYLAAFVNKD